MQKKLAPILLTDRLIVNCKMGCINNRIIYAERIRIRIWQAVIVKP